MMSLTGHIEKLKLLVQRSTNCAGDGDERRKGNCRSQWWKHSTVVGGGLQTPSDKSKVTIVIRIMNFLIYIVSWSIWVCFKQNCDDFRSECPWRSFVVLIAEQSLWMTDSHVFKLVKFVSCKNNPTNKQGVSASYARFWGESVNKEIIDYPALVEQIVSLCSFPKP